MLYFISYFGGDLPRFNEISLALLRHFTFILDCTFHPPILKLPHEALY